MIDSIVKYVMGKVRLIGNTDGALIGNVGDRLKINLNSDSSIFGAAVVAPRSSHVRANFFNAVTVNNILQTTSGGATTTIAGGNLAIESGTAVTSSALVRSNERVIYAPGREIYVMFTAAFTTPDHASSCMRAGLFDDTNGVFLGYSGLTWGVTTRANSADTFTSSLNGDPLNGSATSQFTRAGVAEAIDRTKKNIYRIRFGWLGAAPIVFEVMSPDGVWVIFHTIRQPNVSTTPLLQNPSLPISMQVTKSSANATNLKLDTTSWDGGIVDFDDTDATGSGSITALNEEVPVNVDGKGTLLLSVSGTWAGTLLVEGNVGDGQWVSINGQSPQGNLITSLTVNGVVLVAPAGFSQVRMRASAWTSGTSVVTWTASKATVALQGSVTISSTPAFTFRSQTSVNMGTTLFSTYTAVSKVAIKQFYAGGKGIGKQSLFSYVPETTTYINAGNFESSGDVSTWTVVDPGANSPAVTYSTEQAQTGTGSAKVVFSKSDANNYTGLKQTFASALDLSLWRYVSAYYYNIVIAGGGYTVTVSIILTDNNGSTRKYDLSGTNTTAPFNANGWKKLTGEIDNPTSITGSAFDSTSVVSLELRHVIAGNKAGTIYWDTAMLEGALTPLFPIYHPANASFNVSIDPVYVLNIGDKILITQSNNDVARREYFAMVSGVTI